MTSTTTSATAATFSPVPSLDAPVAVEVATAPPADVALGVIVAAAGDPPAALGVTRAQLDGVGFTGEAGTTAVFAADSGVVTVAVGVEGPVTAAKLRDAAANAANAVDTRDAVAVLLPVVEELPTADAAQAVVEGVLLARYRYEALRREPKSTALRRVVVVASPDEAAAATEGAERGRVFAVAAKLARDLANTPHSHLNASILADLVVGRAAGWGLEVEVWDQQRLIDEGMGGILSINAGSAQPARMIRLVYRPTGEPTGRLALVGKGVMYDSGGISLKPSDRVHAQMKNDMSGAAAVLASMSTLRTLGCTTAVTGYLMCTDNMPSGTATGLGDVITLRGGTTMEMIDTDAEGRVILADGLVLADEDGHDAVIDIATLTGSAMRALGTDMAAIIGSDDAVIAQIEAAAATTDEAVWRMPLHKPYRSKIDSSVADIANCAPIGQPDMLLAGLFLSEFAGDTPWGHIDMCGTAQIDAATTWRPEGCSGYGTRLLAQLALDFTPPHDDRPPVA